MATKKTAKKHAPAVAIGTFEVSEAPAVTPVPPGEELIYAPLDSIQPNPWQFQGRDDQASVDEMARSIEQHGLIETPRARSITGKPLVQLADGHLRLAALKLLVSEGKEQYSTMRLLLCDLGDLEMANIAWEENAKRWSLNPIAEARYFQHYMEQFGVTETELARRRGVSQPVIANALRLLELPDPIKEKVISREITPGHCRQLLKVKEKPELMKRLAEAVVERGMSTRQLNTDIRLSINEHWRALNEGHWPSPKFDTSKCRGCEDTEELEDSRGEPELWCKNKSCWGRKQAEAEREAARVRQEEVAVMAGGQEVVDLGKLAYDEYQSLPGGDDLDKPEECQECEHRKMGSHGGGSSYAVCMGPKCFKKKKTARSRRLNAEAALTYEKILEEFVSLCDLSEPPGKNICLLLLHTFTQRGYEVEKWLLKDICGLSTGYEDRQKLFPCLSGKPLEELRGLIPQAIMRWYHSFDYDRSNTYAERALAVLKGNEHDSDGSLGPAQRAAGDGMDTPPQLPAY